MHVSRWILLLLFILGLLVACSPFLREEISQSWNEARPAVLVFMDGVYAVIRDFVAGSGAEDGIDDNAPGEDFDQVITMEYRTCD
jgi:hypothetical protein